MQATRLVFEDSKVERNILTILYRMLDLGLWPLQGDFEILETSCFDLLTVFLIFLGDFGAILMAETDSAGQNASDGQILSPNGWELV